MNLTFSRLNQSLIAAAVMTAVCGAAAAADVSLYGIVDTGLAYKYQNTTDFMGRKTVDGESSFVMQKGYNTPSRFGLKGTESLGNGYSVGFKLENGFNSDDGTFTQAGNRLFGREASLSVSGPFGTLSFGRMGGIASATGSYDVVYAIGDAFDGGDNDVFGLVASDRYDNMVTYQSPKFAGVQATAQYSFKNDSTKKTGEEGKSSADRYASFAVTGELGNLQTVFGYEFQDYTNTIKGFLVPSKDGHTFYLGGNYDFGVTRLFAMAQYFTGAKNVANTAITSAGFLATSALFKGNKGYGLHLGAVTPVLGGDWTVGIYYMDATISNEAASTMLNPTTPGVYKIDDIDNRYVGIATRYSYPLSKRTAVYVGAGYGRLVADKYKMQSYKLDGSIYTTGSTTSDYKDKVVQAYFGLTHSF